MVAQEKGANIEKTEKIELEANDAGVVSDVSHGSDPSVRTVDRVVTSIRAKEGGGFYIRRPFPTGELNLVDPFLLLDHMEPVILAPGAAKGAPDHPHRGFETVTYLLEGSMIHRDSAGNSGRLSPGDVQWMTAGSGVVHSEMPSESLLRDGGVLHGFQIWVNLPRKDKMIAPRYQDTPAASIPIASTEDGSVKVKVIAGESLGETAVIETRTPIMYLHVTLAPGAALSQTVPANFNSFAYIIKGQGLFGKELRTAGEDQLVVFKKDGANAYIKASEDESLDFLLLGGEPLNEPVARYGPFVMNTDAEIKQAFEDFQSGRMGAISSEN
jgi:redox-sensitive bicupin YhaK (pirin superfamily)